MEPLQAVWKHQRDKSYICKYLSKFICNALLEVYQLVWVLLTQLVILVWVVHDLLTCKTSLLGTHGY